MTRDLNKSRLVFHGAIITPQDTHSIKYLLNALIFIKDGTIQWIEEDVPDTTRLEAILIARGLQGMAVIRLKRDEFLLPGFIDTHTHAPQFPNLGRGGQYELLDWLSNLTYPTESKFGDEHYAKKVYRSVVRRLLDCGTTTCCYFNSSHVVGAKVLADIVHESGQRAFIGQCNMDRNAPDSCRDTSSADSLANTRSVISYIYSLNTQLIRPILTPRFAISCTDELLKGLGNLATDPHFVTHASLTTSATHSRLPVQTHISENLSEIHLTKSLFPHHSSYCAIYDDYGLLGPSTILAHGCHLSSEEIALISKSGAGISHCPTSNFNLSSGLGKVGEWIDHGIKVGLGTDVSGGFSPSMLTAIQHASIASKIVAMESTPLPAAQEADLKPSSTATPGQTLRAVADSVTRFSNRPLPTATLLHMATLGGAELCNLAEHTGSLAGGKAFDALLVNLHSDADNPNVWWDDVIEQSVDNHPVNSLKDIEALLEKFLFCGDDRNIAAVFVQGKLVGGKQYKSRPSTL